MQSAYGTDKEVSFFFVARCMPMLVWMDKEIARAGSLPTAVQHMHERTAARVSGSPLSYSLFRLDADVWNLSTREVEIVDVKVCYVIST
jgi:hypothetical protein